MPRLRAPLPIVTRLARVPVLLLVAALLWAQLLGLTHSVRHAPGLAHAQGHLHPAAPAAHTASDLLAHLLAPVTDEVECQLYDQLGHGGPVAPHTLAIPSALPLLPAWVVLQALLPRPCAAFAARGPPASR